MAGGGTLQRRSVRRQPGHAQPTYREPDTDDDELDAEEQDYAEPGPSSKRRSARQRADRKRPRYNEPDTDDEVEAVEISRDMDAVPPAASTPNRRKTRVTKISKRVSPRNKPLISRSRRVKKEPVVHRFGASKKMRDSKPNSLEFSGPSYGRTPAWMTLPLDILRDIFAYAAQPSLEQSWTTGLDATWLMRTARTCCAFAIPALEAYYQSPALTTNLQPHHLYELLQIPKDKTYIDYQVKVKTLKIDVRRLAYTAVGRPLFDIGKLVKELPQLQHFEITTPHELPPYRPMNSQRWTYPASLFQWMSESAVHLKSWRWSRDMIPNPQIQNYDWMVQIHKGHTFEHLSRLVVCGFDVSNGSVPVQPENETTPRLPDLSNTISALPSLKDLTFISCDVVMEDFLQRLPRTLERLELNNCLEVTAELLRTYLVSGGRNLRELELNHNPALSLAFLPHLKLSCPDLVVLKMNFTYYSERYTFNDAWAMYDELLPDDHIPTWPSALRHVELVHLQKWSSAAAQNLFRSLIESAEELPDLRNLVIHAHIDIAWRDRVGFRDQWVERLRRVFLRNAPDPDPRFGSTKQYDLSRESQAAGRDVVGKAAVNTIVCSEGNTLCHTKAPTTATQASAESNSGSGIWSSHHPLRRSRRVAEVHSGAEEQTGDSEFDMSDDDENGDENGWHKQRERFIQGLCDVVDIRIDNQRPREKQWTEGEFLDSEASGDEDWHEGDELSDGDGYAW